MPLNRLRCVLALLEMEHDESNRPIMVNNKSDRFIISIKLMFKNYTIGDVFLVVKVLKKV